MEEIKAPIEEKKRVEPKKVDLKKWKERKLKAINEMKNEAKAKRLAEKVLSN